MTQREIAEGEVWSVQSGGEISSNERRVAVLRVWHPAPDAADSLEVVPLSDFAEYLWTDRDVRIRPGDRIADDVVAAIRHIVLATIEREQRPSPGGELGMRPGWVWHRMKSVGRRTATLITMYGWPRL